MLGESVERGKHQEEPLHARLDRARDRWSSKSTSIFSTRVSSENSVDGRVPYPPHGLPSKRLTAIRAWCFASLVWRKSGGPRPRSAGNRGLPSNDGGTHERPKRNTVMLPIETSQAHLRGEASPHVHHQRDQHPEGWQGAHRAQGEGAGRPGSQPRVEGHHAGASHLHTEQGERAPHCTSQIVALLFGEVCHWLLKHQTTLRFELGEHSVKEGGCYIGYFGTRHAPFRQRAPTPFDGASSGGRKCHLATSRTE